MVADRFNVLSVGDSMAEREAARLGENSQRHQFLDLMSAKQKTGWRVSLMDIKIIKKPPKASGKQLSVWRRKHAELESQ